MRLEGSPGTVPYSHITPEIHSGENDGVFVQVELSLEALRKRANELGFEVEEFPGWHDGMSRIFPIKETGSDENFGVAYEIRGGLYIDESFTKDFTERFMGVSQ